VSGRPLVPSNRELDLDRVRGIGVPAEAIRNKRDIQFSSCLCLSLQSRSAIRQALRAQIASTVLAALPPGAETRGDG
jgi:hypothetical protein